MNRKYWIAGGVVLLLLAVGAAMVGSRLLPVLFLRRPLISFEGPEPFVKEPGTVAQQKIPYLWPEAVDPKKVISVSFEAGVSIDSHSHWYRVELGPEEAHTWADVMHARGASIVKNPDQRSAPEGVTRTLQGAIPLRRQTGATPTWWSPPNGTLRATEVMDWYTESESGDGLAVYSIYDEDTGVLWVYDYSAQHDWMWDRGELPEDGEVIE